MAVITDATTSWSSTVTLSADEFWQVRKGPVYLATAATSAPASVADSLLLSDGDVVQLTSGEVVRYASARADGTAIIVRRAKA